jgi:DNA-binding response OmpR family regulator
MTESVRDDEGLAVRVLVVDDDDLVLRTTVRVLMRAGYEVTSTTSVEQALQLMRQQWFHAVVSDLEMPGMHGDILCREAQKIRPTPLILASGNHSVVDERAQACGAKMALYKPVDPKVLREAVEAVRRRS